MKGVYAHFSDSELARNIQAATARRSRTQAALADGNYDPAQHDSVCELQALLDGLWGEFLRRTQTALRNLSRSLADDDYPAATARTDLLLHAVEQMQSARISEDWEANLFLGGYVKRAAIRQRAGEEWSIHGTIDNPDVIRARFLIDELMGGDIDSRVKEVKPVRGVRKLPALVEALAKELGQAPDSHHRLSVEQIEGYLAVKNFISDGDVLTGTEMTVFDLFGAHHEDEYDLAWYTVLLKFITQRELAVLRHAFGIETAEIESQAQIASLLGVSQKTVSRALESALDKLREVGHARVRHLVYFGDAERWYEGLFPAVTRRELAVLRHTYGIETAVVTSQRDIASLIGITEDEVTDALQSAHAKLDKPKNRRFRRLLELENFELAA